MAKPFLRWAGSKRKMLPYLIKYWNPDKYNKYIEPFAGSAQLFFSVQPTYCIINDINEDLINTYIQIRDNPEIICDKVIQRTPLSREDYYLLRKTPAYDLNAADRAVRFLLLNKNCFNGLYRTNLNGEFNVPYSESASNQIDLSNLYNVSNLLRGKTILCEDFEQVIENHVEPGDFVYLDPPYANIGSRIFKEYHPSSFNGIEIDRLLNILELIKQRDAYFVLSYQHTPKNEKDFSSWSTNIFSVRRDIAGNSNKRKSVNELIISNING